MQYPHDPTETRVHPYERPLPGTLYVLIFQEYQHKHGKRYRHNSPMLAVFPTLEDARDRVAALKTLANPDQLDRQWGAVPTSIDYTIHKQTETNTATYAIQAGTTTPYIVE